MARLVTDAYRNRMTFAGRPFRTVPEKVREHIDRYYPLDHLRDVASPFPASHAKNLLALSLPQASDPAPRLNDLWYPTGATRWAWFRGLMTGPDVAAAAKECYATGTATAAEFVLEANGVAITTDLYMLPPRPVAALGRSVFDDLYLVTLVDERYYWQSTPAGEITCTSDGTDTWAGLIAVLGAALEVAVAHDPIEAAYGTPEPDSALYSHHESAAALLEACAHNTGRVLCRNFDGTYDLVTLADANARAAERNEGRAARAGGLVLPFGPSDPAPARGAVLPRRVLVTFPRWAGGSYELPSPNYRSWERDSYPLVYSAEVTAADLGAPYSGLPTVDATQVCRTSAKAMFASPAAAVPTNLSAVQDLARKLARDALERHSGAADAVYPAVYAAEPRTAHDLLFAWSGVGKPYTRLTRRPWNFFPVEFQHGFGPTAEQRKERARGVCPMPPEEGEEGAPGPPGPRGRKGDRGRTGAVVPGEPGEDGETIPGPRGRTGATGARGRDGASVPGDDGSDGESLVGPRGRIGTRGRTGPMMLAEDGADGERGPPGRPGPASSGPPGLIGPDYAQTGQVAFFNNPNAQELRNAQNLFYFDYTSSSPTQYQRTDHTALVLRPAHGIRNLQETGTVQRWETSLANQAYCGFTTARVEKQDYQAVSWNPGKIAGYCSTMHYDSPTPASSLNYVSTDVFFDGSGYVLLVNEQFRLGLSDSRIETSYDTARGVIVRNHIAMEMWMKHFTDNGQPGVANGGPNTDGVGGVYRNGLCISINARPAVYSLHSGITPSRVLNPTSTLADVIACVAQIILDLKAQRVTN